MALYGVARRRRVGLVADGGRRCGLVIWIVTEVALLGFLPDSGVGLQIGMGVLGVVILALALAKPTRSFFGVGRR